MADSTGGYRFPLCPAAGGDRAHVGGGRVRATGTCTLSSQALSGRSLIVTVVAARWPPRPPSSDPCAAGEFGEDWQIDVADLSRSEETAVPVVTSVKTPGTERFLWPLHGRCLCWAERRRSDGRGRRRRSARPRRSYESGRTAPSRHPARRTRSTHGSGKARVSSRRRGDSRSRSGRGCRRSRRNPSMR